MIRHISLILVLLVTLSPTSSASIPADDQQQANAERRPIHFICPLSDSDILFRISDIILGDFFNAHGYAFSISSIPDKRVIQQLEMAHSDGICAISDLRFQRLKHSPYLLGDNDYGTIDVVIASVQQLPPLMSIHELTRFAKQSSPVGYVAGSPAAEILHNIAFPIENVVSIDRGIRMLAAGRLKYLLTTKMVAQHMVTSIQADSVINYSNTLYKLKLQNALHKRHQHLRQPLNRYLRRLAQCLKDDATDVKPGQWPAIALQPRHSCRTEALKTIN